MWRTPVLTMPATVMTVKTTMAFVSVTTVTATVNVVTVCDDPVCGPDCEKT